MAEVVTDLQAAAEVYRSEMFQSSPPTDEWCEARNRLAEMAAAELDQTPITHAALVAILGQPNLAADLWGIGDAEIWHEPFHGDAAVVLQVGKERRLCNTLGELRTDLRRLVIEVPNVG